MQIDENTKISDIINKHPSAIDAIVRLSGHFEKLRIPILRKTLAKRVTIKQAARIGGVSVSAFYGVLSPLGFVVPLKPQQNFEHFQQAKNACQFTGEIKNEETFDVRQLLQNNKDPFNLILKRLKDLPIGHTLNVINTFEPIPLISILTTKGFQCQVNQINEQLFHTYITKTATSNANDPLINAETDANRKNILRKYTSKIVELDVRDLEMPLPMSKILNALLVLPNDHLLFVHHKKVPQLLLPALAERGYQWHIDEIGGGDVKLLVFKE